MEWTPKEHVAGYIVLYMRSGIRDIVPKVVHNISEPRVMIGSLEADTKYNFQVAAVSQHGSGPFSKPKGFQTFGKCGLQCRHLISPNWSNSDIAISPRVVTLTGFHLGI